MDSDNPPHEYSFDDFIKKHGIEKSEGYLMAIEETLKSMNGFFIENDGGVFLKRKNSKIVKEAEQYFFAKHDFLDNAKLVIEKHKFEKNVILTLKPE